MHWFRRLQRWASVVFALDYRSLAVYRMAMGIILLLDVYYRSQTLTAMYTDAGILPRPLMRELWQRLDAAGLQQWGVGTWCIHALSGSLAWQATLFGITAFVAILLLTGTWTRLASVASFILIVSVHNRIPLALTSGDTHLRLILFWSMFLPLGRVWSVDAWRRGAARPTTTSVSSAASAGFIVQMFILYFFSGLAKWNSAWLHGDALDIVLRLSYYTSPLAESILQFEWLCKVISIGTVLSEVFLPLLLFVPYRNAMWRWINLLVFVAMHIGIALAMSIGLFPYICCATWLAIIPSGFWRALNVEIPLAKELAPHPSPASTWLQGIAQVFCGIMIPFVLIWNVINIDQTWVAKPIYDPQRPQQLLGFDETTSPIFHAYEIAGHWMGVGQHFQMFGQPSYEDSWFIFRATLNDGTVRDVFLGGRPWKEGEVLTGRDAIPNHHWRQVLRNLIHNPDIFVRQRVATYAAEQWNATHPPPQQIARLQLECYLDTTWPNAIPGESKGAIVWGTFPDGLFDASDPMSHPSRSDIINKGF